MASFQLVTGGALAGGLFQGLMQQGREAQPTLEPGTVIGRFRIEQLIDQGGAASVYRAERCDDAFRQSVALKVTHHPITDAAHLVHEHNALGRLRHPVIATILDGGALDDGRAWMAIELVDGLPLDEWCRQTRPGWRERVSLACRIADGLVYAHGRGVAHCDIKPSNVLVTHEGDPKLIDFGIAAEDGGLAPAMSTPGFASPEQRAGQPGSPLSDIFQLGLLLDLLIRSTDDPVADIARDRARLANLAAIVDKATQPAPDLRYASVADMRRDLRRVLADKPVGARRNSPATIVYWSVRRNRRAVAIGVVLLAVLAGATAHFRDSLSNSYQQRDRATQAASLSSDFLEQIIQIASAGNRDSALALVDKAAARVDAWQADSPLQNAGPLQTLATAYLDLGQPDKALGLLSLSLQRLPPEQWREHLNLLLMRARIHAFIEKHPEAHSDVKSAQALMRQHGVPGTSTDYASLNATMAQISYDENDPIAALRQASRAVDTLERIDATNSDDYAYALSIVARAQQQLGRHDEMKRSYKRAVSSASNVHGPTARMVMALEREAISFQLMQADETGVRNALLRQRQFVLMQHGPDSVEYADLLSSQAFWAWSQERYAEAATYFRQQIALLERRDSLDQDDLPNALHNLGESLYELGRFEEAHRTFLKANELRRARGMAATMPMAAGLMHEFAAACELQRPAAALARFPEARAAIVKTHPKGHRNLATVDIFEARCLMRVGRMDEARQLFATAKAKLSKARLSKPMQRRIERLERELGAGRSPSGGHVVE